MRNPRSLPRLDNFEVYRPSATSVRAQPASYATEELLTKRQRIVSWTCRIIAAAIMLETLFFKFTGAPESVYIFSKMNLESWWRYGQGIWELIASLLLLFPRTTWAGGIVTLEQSSAI